ncbi:hypothetical protein BIW11_01113 [Tropilaelaps mercedesae]|uniref:Uncharacterized protein n=1 Tax=Tropilaelaps mercedesae TaxID=418985 RepID=A0A1V9XJC1_9ACAR|nr:hypothetical protein BIW11_01113 [Tropilaelaps mercedesae]
MRSASRETSLARELSTIASRGGVMALGFVRCDALADAACCQLGGVAMCQKRVVKQVSWDSPVAKTIEFDPSSAPFCGHEFVVTAGWRVVLCVVAAAGYLVWLTSNLK